MRLKPEIVGNRTRVVRGQTSRSGASSESFAVVTKMTTTDLAEIPKERGSHVRQVSDGGPPSELEKKRRVEGISTSSRAGEGAMWVDTASTKSKTDDSIASVKSEQPETRHLKLALPTRRSTRGTLIYHPADDDFASTDGLSDSTTSQHTIPDVPASARNRSGSLSAFNKTLARFVSVLEDGAQTGTPPLSLRDTGSSSSQSLIANTSSKPQNPKTKPTGNSGLTTSSGSPTMNIRSTSNSNHTQAKTETNDNSISTAVVNNRIAALDWLINSVVNDRHTIITLDQVLRNRDLCESRRPYERLVQTLVTAPVDTLASHALDLINILITEQSPANRCDFFEALEKSTYTPVLNKLRRSESVVSRLLVGTFERLFIDHLHWQTLVNWDPRDPRLAARMNLLMKQCEPIHSFPPVVWENCSRVAFLACCHLGEHYPHVIRRILDENESQTSDTYCLPLVSSIIAQFLVELIVAHAPIDTYDTSRSTPPSRSPPASFSASSNPAPTKLMKRASPVTSISEPSHDEILELSEEDLDNSESRTSPKPIRTKSNSKGSADARQETGKPIFTANMHSILFSEEHGFDELFSMALMVFDTVWKESTTPTNDKLESTISKTRHLIYLSCAATTTIATLKEHLMLKVKLSQPKPSSPSEMRKMASSIPSLVATQSSSSGSASGLMSSLSSSHTTIPPMTPKESSSSHDNVINSDSASKFPSNLPFSPAEMRLYFVEIVRWVTTPVDKSMLVLLADGVGAMRALASQPGFPWDVATEHLLFHLLRNIGGSDGLWLRILQLSSQTALWIDQQLNSDPHGPEKLVEALELIAGDHSEGYSYTKPLVRMLRSTRQLSIPLRIINRLFEYKMGELERRAYLNDLARCQALSIMKSKVWSTFAEVKHELLRFQSNLLSLHQTKFDPSIRDHEQLLAECWHAAFPRVRLKHVGAIQWALLGFRKATSINSFRGSRLLGFRHLLHFINTQTSQAHHLILSNHPNPLPLGDSSCALSAILIRLLMSNECIMPMIFDEDRDGFAEIHSSSMLWLIQTWLLDPTIGQDNLLVKTESHVMTIMKANKATTAVEFTKQLGISNELIAAGWAKVLDRQSGPIYRSPSVSSGLLAAQSGGSSTSLTSSMGSSSLASPSSPALLHHGSSRQLIPQPHYGSGEPAPSIGTSGHQPSVGTVNLSKARKILGTDSLEAPSERRGTIALTSLPTMSRTMPAEPDYLEEYLEEHHSEMALREHTLANYIESQTQNAKKGRQRGSSRAERELAESERLSRTIAANRITLPLELISAVPDDDKHIKEIVKLRKTEAKEQKEVKATIAKQKPFRT